MTRRRITGALVLALGLLAIVIGYSGRIPLAPRGGTVVEMTLRDASLVRAGTPVRIHGVDVGKVEDVTQDRPHDPSRVRMRIDDDAAAALRADAGAAVWWRTLLGGASYVQLDPGSARAPLRGPIPFSRTQTQVELDEIVRSLDTDARGALQDVVTEFRRGLGDPAAAGAAIEHLAPAAREAAPVLRALRGERRGDLSRSVANLDRVTAALAHDERALGGLIDGADLVLAVTAARHDDLGRSLTRLPATLRSVRAEADALPATLARLDPIVAGARPAARRVAGAAATLTPAVRQLRALLRDARPVLADLETAAPRLRAGAGVGIPMVADLDPTARRLTRELVPWLRSRDPRTGREVHQLIGPVIAALTDVTQPFDANGNALRFAPGGGSRTIGVLPCEQFFSDPNSQQLIVCQGLARIWRSFNDGLRRNR